MNTQRYCHLTLSNARLSLRIRLLFCSAILVATCLSAQSTHAKPGPTYRIAPIPQPSNTWWSNAKAINNRGDVVGEISLNDIGLSGYIWNKHNGLDILSLSSHLDSSSAYDINERGDVIGWSRYTNEEGLPTIWRKGNKVSQLDTLGGAKGSAVGLNNSREIVGVSLPGIFPDKFQSSVWLDDNPPFNPDADVHDRSQATDINDQGVVIGYVWHLGNTKAYTWNAEDGYHLYNFPYPHNFSQFLAINEQGWITGTAGNFQAHRAFLIDPEGEIEVLDTALLKSEGLGINDHNTIVGRNGNHANNMHAMIWDEDLGMRDLNDLIDSQSGWTLTIANDINNRGQIVGMGTFKGRARAFLLTPNPEPATVLIYTSGLSLCILCRHRHKARPPDTTI